MRKKAFPILPLLASLFLEAGTGDARETPWVRTWASAPSDVATYMPVAYPIPISDLTIRTVLRISVGGDTVRVKLSNELSANDLSIGTVHVALRREGRIVPGSDRVLAFGGQPGLVVAAGASALSDPLDFRLEPLSDLVVSLYVAGPAPHATAHLLGHDPSEFLPGAQAAAISGKQAHPTILRYILSGVDVRAKEPHAATLVTLGDSITDGVGSTFGANARWPDRLAEKLNRGSRGAIGVANAGISGNQLLREGYGPSALARFDRDVLAVPNVRYLLMLIGINDIGMAGLEGRPLPTAEAMIAGYRQLIARAHAHGICVIGATLTPFQGSGEGYYSASGEALRGRVNAWIRTGGHFDAVVDFDQVVRSPTDPARLRSDYDSGDHLHLSDQGYAALASAAALTVPCSPRVAD